MDDYIEFVKHFRSHLGPIMDMTVNYNGTLLCTVSTDKSLKVFDVINFGGYYVVFKHSVFLCIMVISIVKSFGNTLKAPRIFAITTRFFYRKS